MGTKHKPRTKFRPGDAIYLRVEREHIDDSDPCNKDECMVNRAFYSWYGNTYGHSNCKAKSTNHGLTFELNEREYGVVFDTKTATKIYNYDSLYRRTHSKQQARASVKPFTVRLMVERSVAVTKWPKMSQETKERL